MKKDKNTTNVDTQEEQLKKNAEISIEKSITSQTHKPVDLRSKIGKIKSVFNEAEKLGIANNVNESNSELHEIFTEYTRAITSLSNGEKSLAVGNSDIKDIGAYIKSLSVKLEKFENIASQYAKEISIQRGVIEKDTKVQSEINGQKGNNGIKSRIKSDASSQIPSEITTNYEDPNILKRKYARYMPRQDHVSEEKITTVNKPKETSRSSGLIKTNSAGYIDTIGGISYSGKGGILSNLSVFQDKNNDVYQKKREQIITLFSQLVGEDIEKVANAITAQISRKGYHSNNALALKNIIQTLDNFKNVNMGEQINGIFLDEIPQEQSNKFTKNMGISIDKKELSISADKDLKEITTTPQNPKGLKLSELNKKINNIKKQRDTFVESHKEDSNADYYKQKIDDYYDQIEQAKQERNAYIEQYVENMPDIAMPQEIEEKLSQNLSEKELTMKKKEYSQQKKKDMVESIKNLADRPNSKNIVSTVNGHQVWEWGEVYNKLDEKKTNMQRINREQLYSNEYNTIEAENNAIKNTMLQLEQNNMPNKEQEQQKLQQKLLENQQKQREIENRGPQIQQIDAQMSGIVRLLSSAMIDEVNEGDSYLGGKLGEYANADGGKYSSMSKKVFEKISEYSEGLSRLFNVGSWEERNNTSKTPGRISDAIIKGEKRPKNPDEWLAYMKQRKDSNIERENDSSVMLDLETLFENLKNNNQLRSKMTNPNIDEKEKKELTIKMIESIQDIIFNNGGLGQDRNMSYLDSGINSTIKERLMDQKSAAEDKNFNNLYGSEDLMTLFRNAVSRIFDTMLDNPNNNASDKWFLERQKNLAMKQVDSELNKMGFLYTDKKPLDSTQVGNRLAKIATAQNTIDFNASRISEKTGMDMKESLNTIFDNNESLQEEYSLSEHINNIFSNEGINFSTLKEGDSDYIELQKKVIQIMQSFKDSKYRELQNLYNSLQNLSPKEQLESARLFINQMTKGAFSLNDKVINDDEYVHDYLIPNGDLSPKEKNQMQYTDSTALLYGDNIIDNYNNDDLKSRIQKAENLKQSHMDELKNDEEMFEGMSPEDFDLYEDRKKILEELTSLYKSSFGVTVDDLGNEDIDWDNAINNAPDEDRKQEIINSQQKYINAQKSLADFKSEKIKQNKQKHQGMIDLIDEDLDRYKRELHSQEIYESFSTNFRQSEEGEKSLNQNINDNSKKKEDGGKRKDSKQEDMDLNNSEDYIVLSTKPTGFNPDDGHIPVSMGVYDPKTNKQNDFLIDFSDKDLNYSAYNLAMNLGLFDEEGNELPENKRNVMQSAKELRTEFFGDKFKDNEVINLDSLSPELQNVFEGKLKEKGQNISDIQDSMMSIIGNKKVAGLNLKDDISLMSNLFETLLGQSNLTDLINKNGIIDATKKENIDNIDNPPTENVSIEDNEPQNPPVLVEPDNRGKQPVAMAAGGNPPPPNGPNNNTASNGGDNPPPNGPNNNTPPNDGGNVPPNGNDDINSHSDAINEAIVAEDNKIKKSQELVKQLELEKQAFKDLNEIIREHVIAMDNASTAEKNKATIAGNNANNVGQNPPLENSPVGPTPPIGNNNTPIGGGVNNGYIDLWSGIDQQQAIDDVLKHYGVSKINASDIANAEAIDNLYLDDKGHSYYTQEDGSQREYLDKNKTHSATHIAGKLYGKEYTPNSDYEGKKSLGEQILAGEYKAGFYNDENDVSHMQERNLDSITQLEELTGLSFNSVKKSLSDTMMGNFVHDTLDFMSKNNITDVNALGQSDDENLNNQWNEIYNKYNPQYQRIYGTDTTIDDSPWKEKVGVLNYLNENAFNGNPSVSEMSLGMKIGDQNFVGTLDSLISDFLTDYKTTKGMDPNKMGFQLNMLERLISVNKERIASSMGISPEDFDVDNFMNNMIGQIAHVTGTNNGFLYEIKRKFGQNANGEISEEMKNEAFARELNLYNANKLNEANRIEYEIAGINKAAFRYAKPIDMGESDSNRELINRVSKYVPSKKGLPAGVNIDSRVRDYMESEGFSWETSNLNKETNNLEMTFTRLDEATGQLLKTILTINPQTKDIVGRRFSIKNQEPQESEHEKAYRHETKIKTNNAMKDYIKDLQLINKLKRELLALDTEIDKGGTLSGYNLERKKALEKEIAALQAGLGKYEDGILSKDGEDYILDETQRINFEHNIDNENKDHQRFINKFNNQNKPGFFSNFFNSIKEQVNQYIGYSLSYQIIGMIRQAIQSAIQQIKQLDQTMVNLQIVTGKNRDEVKSLMSDYNKFAKELGSSTQEVASSANEFLRMGYNIQDTNELIKQSMVLSKVGMIDTAQATEYLTSAIKGYKIAAQDASEVVDMATSLDMKYAVSAGYILEAMSRTANSARLAKVSMSELQSMIAVTGEVTQREASVIGEGFKTAFARYGNLKSNVAVTTDMTGLDEASADELEKVNDIEKVLNKYGISMREADNRTWRSYSDILKDVGQQWSKYSDYEKNAISTAMFGTRQREIGLTTLENYDRVLAANETATYANGSAMEKFNQYLNGVEASVNRLTSAWEGFVQKLSMSGAIKKVYDLLTILIENLKLVGITAGAVAFAFNWDKIFVTIAKFSNLFSTKFNSIGTIFSGMFGKSGKKNIGGLWDIIKGKASDAYGEAYQDSIDQQQLVAITHTNSLLKKIYNLIAKKYGEKQLDVNSNPSQNSSSNRQNGDMSMYKWTRWSKKRSAKGKSDFNPVVANMFTTGGLVMGATGGMSIGGQLAKDNNWNEAAGNLIGGALGAGITTAALYMGGPIAAAVTGAILQGFNLWYSIDRKYKEDQKQREIKQAQELQQIYTEALGKKNDIRRYDELAKGVTSTGKNKSLTDSEYQEFLTLTDTLGQTFPMLRSVVDETGKRFLGTNGEIGNIGTTTEELIQQYQKDLANKALSTDVWQTTVDYANLSSQVKDVESEKKLFSIDFDDIEENAEEVKYNILKNIKEQGFTEGVDFKYDENNPNKIIFSSDAKVIKQLMPTNPWKDEGKGIISNSDDMSQAVLSGLNNILPYLLQKYDGQLSDIEKTMLIPLLKNIDLNDLQSSDFIDKWFDINNKNGGIHSYGLDDFAPLQEGDAFTRNFGTMVDEVDPIIKSFVEKNQNNEYVKKGFGLEENEELTTDIVKKQLGYDYIDELKEDVKNALGDTSEGFSETTTSFFNQITENQAKQISKLSQSEISSIQQKAVENKTDVSTELLKYISMIGGQNASDLFRTVSSLIQSSNKNDVFTDKEIKDIIKNYKETNTLSDNIDESTKSAMDQLIKMSDILNIDLDKMLNNLDILSNIDAMGRVEIKYSEIKEKSDNLKTIKEQLSQGYIDPATLETLSQSNNYEQIIDIMLDPNKGIGDLIDIFNDSLDVLEEVYRGRIKTDLENNNTIYDENRSTIEQPVEGYSATVHNGNELITGSAMFGETHNLVNGVANFNKIEDFNIEELRRKYNLDNQKNLTEDEFFKFVIESYGDTTAQTDFKSAPIETTDEDVKTKEDIVTDVLRSLANAINNYGSFDTVITNAVDTIYNNYFSANNQEKVENAWKLYDFEQQEKNWNKQQKEYNKNKKRYDRQRRKLEKQGRDIDKQERLNELEDFLARRNAIIEAYNSKIENLQWGKDLLSEQDFEGKMDLTRQLMEQELFKQEELKKQFVELQKLNPQSAEEAQKQSEAMKNVASQIKESTKNYLEMEKAINDLSIEALNNTISESFEMINKQMDILSKAANTSDLNKTLISSNVAQSLIGTDFNYSDEEQNEAEKKRDIMEESLRIQQYYEDEYLKSHQDYLDKLKEQNAENIKEQREDLADQIQDLNDQIQEAQDTYNSNYLSFLKQKMEIMIAIPEADLSLTNAQYKLLEEQQTRLGGKMPALFQTDNGLWKSKKKTSDVPKTVKHNYVEGADGTVTEFSGEDKVAVYTKTTRPTPNGEEVIDLIDENGKVVKTFTKKQYNSLIGKKTDEDNPDEDEIPDLNPMLSTLKGAEADNKKENKEITNPEKIQKAMVETLQDGLSNMDAKSIINDDVKKKMNEILTQYIKTLKSEWDNIISDNEDSSEKIILSFASLLGYTEEEKTTLLDSFKQLGSNVGQSFIDGIGLALNNYAIDKIITLDNGKKYVQSPDQVGFEPIEDVNKKSPLVNTFLKSIDESELSDLIIEKLKTAMELVKKKWTEDIITDEQYQLSKILLDENEWSTDESKTYASGVGYLANDILEAIRNALMSALKMYEEIRVDSQYRLYKPYLLYSGRNGWGMDGLGQDILNQLAAVYNKVNDSSDLFKINAPKPDEASWTSFGQEIGKYISDAINQGIQDGEYTRIENGIDVGGNPIPPKEPAKDIGGGDSVYDVMKKLHPTARQTSAYDESDRYGIRSGRKHRGYDLGIAMGADVRTPVAGTVTFAGSNSSYGNYIKIQDNNGYLHYFGHNSKLNVKEGDLVSAGQIIAQAGSTGNSTGPHIHYEVHDPTGNVIDPNSYKPSGYLMNNADNNGLVNLVAMLFGLNNQSLGLENGDWQARENYLTQFLRQKGVSNKGIAALLGNLWQESTGYNSKNIQGSFESKLGNDVDYTNKINSGSYSRDQFINDKAGYGIGQWTYSTRKAALWDALKGNGYNIDDFGQQVEFLWQELQKSGIVDYMNGDYSLINITKYICDKFFRPGKPNLLGREINARNALSRISHATGTKYHKGGNALLGDQNFLQGKKEPSPETLIYPNGEVEIVGEQGPVIKDIPQGTKVLTTKETKGLFNTIPNYAEGTNVGDSIEPLIDSTDNLTKTIDEFKKHADTILKANLIYAQNAFNRQAIYKRDMADIWDEKIKNNDNMDYFKLIDYNMYKSNYLQSNVSMEYQSYINVAKKTLKGLQEQFETETDVTKKRAIGEAMSTVLDQIETWEQHISEVVQSMLSNAQKGVDERQRIYDDIKSIIDSDVSLGFKQLTSGDFAKRTEDLMNIYYNQLGALSEMKTILYNEYKATGKYSEAQIQQLIENNETVKSAEKNLGTILTSVKQNKIEDYENQIKKPNQLKESLSSKYEGLIDNDIKALNDLYFKNNNSLIKNSDMLIRNYEARLADTSLNLSEDERVELIDKSNSEMKNKLQKAYEGVSKVIDANQKSIETDMSNNEGLAKIGVKDTYLRASYQDAQNGYNFDYYAQQAKEINKLIDNANRKYLNAVENAKKEALLLGYKENSTDYNNYIENNQNVRDAYKERLDYEEQFKENQKADLDNMTKKIENEQTLLDLRKQEQWNSTSSINAYYTKTLQNVQQKRDELVDYMQRAKLSREEYEELRMQIAELDHQLYETELNKLKDTQAFYQSQYSAMTYMVGEYTDALNDEKESLSERYDEEIRKLQEVNDSKERSIKLTELQNNLNNAQKERKRVYRAGVGFVYEEDRESIKKAKDELEDFYKEDRLSSLQKAKELETKILDDRISAWNKYLKAMEKVYKTAERHENMSLLESLFGVSGWNGIWDTLDTDMDQFLKKYEAGEKIYSGSSTELLNKYISISEDIYDKVTKVVDILEKNVPDFYTQDVEITGQADSNLRGIEVKPWKDYDERTNNKPTLDNYNWRTFSYNTYDKNGNIIGSNKVPDYAYALGDEGSAIREMIQKTYNMSEEQASALLKTLQNQKVEELTSKFTTGEFKDVDLHDIFLNGVSNNTGYTLKELRDALLLKMNWMASQLDPNSEEFKKIMQEVDDIGSGTKQMTISLENLLKSKPNVSVDELLEYAGGLIDRSDFVKDNFVNNLLSDTDKGNYLKNLSEDDIQKLLNSLGLESMQTNKLKNQFKAFVNKDFVDGGKYADVDIASILMGKTKNTTEYSLDELVDARLVKTAWNSVNGATDEIKNTNKEFMNQINSGEDLMVDLKSVLGLIDNPTFENVMKYVGSRPLDMSSLLYGADNFKQNMSSTGSVGEFLRSLSSEDLNTLLDKAGVPEGGDREWYSQQLELFKNTVTAISENSETDVNNSTLEDIKNLTQEIKDNLVKYFVSYGENLEDLINGDLSKNVLEEDLLQSAYEQQKALISEAIDKYGNGGGLNGVLDYMDGQNLSMLNGVSYKVFMAALEDKVFDMINKGLLNVYKSDGVTIDELATKRNINKYLRLPENDVSAQNNMLKDFFPSTLPAGLGGIPTEQVVTTGNGIGVNSLPKATSLLTSDRSVIQNNYEMYMIAKENSTFASIVQQANSQAKITNERRA